MVARVCVCVCVRSYVPRQIGNMTLLVAYAASLSAHYSAKAAMTRDALFYLDADDETRVRSSGQGRP